MLHPVFERALCDRVLNFNLCAHTEPPKVVTKKVRTLIPAGYAANLIASPCRTSLGS